MGWTRRMAGPKCAFSGGISPGIMGGMWRLVVGYAERQQWPPRVCHAGCNERHGVHCELIPYGGSSYCRNAIRVSAFMGVRSIYVLTHDLIGLGEDGPTHQPVEHLASLRAIPNLHVFRPVDTIERWSAGISPFAIRRRRPCSLCRAKTFLRRALTPAMKTSAQRAPTS